MKKIFFIILFVSLGVILMACNDKQTNNSQEETKQIEFINETDLTISTGVDADLTEGVVAKYGDFNANKIVKQKYGWQFQFLHAHRLKLNGLKGELSYLNNKIFEAPLPLENKKLLEKLRKKNDD